MKTHDLDAIRTSILAVGYADAAIMDERTGRLIGGHGRHEVLFELRSEGIVPRGIRVDQDGRWLVPVQRGWSSADDNEAHTLLIAVNYIGEKGGWNVEARDRMLVGLHTSAPDLLAATGYAPAHLDRLLADVRPGGLATAAVDAVDNARRGSPDRDYDDWDGDSDRPRREPRPVVHDAPPPRPSLADRFGIPPFDVWDTRTGWWTQRRRRWTDLGIRSELGRAANVRLGVDLAADGSTEVIIGEIGEAGLTFRSASGRDPAYYAQKGIAEEALGRKLTAEEFEREHYVPSDKMPTGTSVFDPVVCELAYRWFCPPGGSVVDPFAGGSVRGLMAAMLGRSYLGCDLRAEQVEANEQQAREFGARGLISDKWMPSWVTGNAATWVEQLPLPSADFLLTCPPYWNMEVYSDDPRDLSTMKLPEFKAAYEAILSGAARALAENRFAMVVVGDPRPPRGGALFDLRGFTIAAAERAGLTLHNAAVIVNHVGSLAVRAGRWFEQGRTLGGMHQHALIFVKGDRRLAAAACGPVEVADAGTGAVEEP